MLVTKDALYENVKFCKCLNECLQKLDHKLDVNMFLPVLVTDILEYFAFSEDLSCDNLKKVDSASSEIFTWLTRAVNMASKGICDLNTLASVAYIRKLLKNAVVVLKTWKFDCSNNLVFAQLINAVLYQKTDIGFPSLLSSELLHLFLKTVEHVSGQENMEKNLRKLDKTITVLQNIKWSNEIVEETPEAEERSRHSPTWNKLEMKDNKKVIKRTNTTGLFQLNFKQHESV
ncbi:ARHGEF14_21_22 [Mytilus edulis]|uniref:MCF2 n=1 Tax=Mytilus edulis TaxID=6550 RepID=A0A8S3Q8R7_MYTED|nr:ARHGEF14_21_22 [Mytilus edulis]